MTRTLLALLLMLTSGAAGAEGPAADFEARLGAAVARGEVTETRAALHRLQALRDPARLPAFLRADPVPAARASRSDGDQPHGRLCGTPVLRAVVAELAAMAPGDRAEAEALLDLPASGPAARATPRAGGKAVTHELSRWALTDNFSIEWGEDLTNEDGSRPARDTGPAFAGDPARAGNGIPDVVERWAAYFEASYADIVGAQGYTHPALTGHRVSVFLGNSEPTRTIDDISPDYFALTTQDSPVAHIVVTNNPSRFASDPAQVPGIMKVTAAHEFFHVIHFLYQPNYANDDHWWLEASATWMEDEVFDSVNDYYRYFRGQDGWATYVEKSLAVPSAVTISGSAEGINRTYGGAIFAKYLAEHVGGRGAVWEVWDRLQKGQRILPALDSFARERELTAGLPELFLGFAAANATMDYEEGANYGTVPTRGSGLAQQTAPGRVPGYLGATYLFEGAPASRLEVSLVGSPARRWGLGAVIRRAAGGALALGALAQAGVGTLAVEALGPGDGVYAIPAYLDVSATATGYATTAAALAPGGESPPGTPSPEAIAGDGGFHLSWGTVLGAEGYVVRRRLVGQSGWTHRTVRAPVTLAEMRGLAAGTYDLELFAYGPTGTVGAAGASQVTVTEGAADTPLPPNAILEVGSNPLGGDGDSGGGGCFFQALGR